VDRGKVEAGEVEQLEPLRIGQHRLQIGRIIGAARRKADKMLVAFAIGNLDHTQTVARGHEPHRLGIDGNDARCKDIGGQVFFMEIYGHGRTIRRSCDREQAAKRAWAIGKDRSAWQRSRHIMTATAIPESWRPALGPVLQSPPLKALGSFLRAEEASGKAIYPPRGTRLAALELTPLDSVRVVILGQDPYHGAGQAHGLAFPCSRACACRQAWSTSTRNCRAISAFRPRAMVISTPGRDRVSSCSTTR
jgi:hypothetical protein